MIHADTIGAAYWEKRAETAEEKVKDWSARTEEVEARIAQAKAILETAKSFKTEEGFYVAVLDALAALEGK